MGISSGPTNPSYRADLAESLSPHATRRNQPPNGKRIGPDGQVDAGPRAHARGVPPQRLITNRRRHLAIAGSCIAVGKKPWQHYRRVAERHSARADLSRRFCEVMGPRVRASGPNPPGWGHRSAGPAQREFRYAGAVTSRRRPACVVYPARPCRLV
jgi:hypothetical protein